jgi:hypothetical protein
MTDGGVWTAKYGSGQGKGNGHGNYGGKNCPAGAFISNIAGSFGDGLTQIGLTCSDGTVLGGAGPGGGYSFNKTCKTGFIPSTGDGGWWVDGLTMNCDRDPSSNIVFGGNSDMKCPTGYVASGYKAEGGDGRVGQLVFQCAPGTKETKIACCMSNSSNDIAKCREYLPQSTTCDAFMRAQAKLSPEEDVFACLKPVASPFPQCTDSKCQQTGYKPYDMDPNNCPTSLSLMECNQIVSLKDATDSTIADNKLTQNCQLAVSKANAKSGSSDSSGSSGSSDSSNSNAAAAAAAAAAKAKADADAAATAANQKNMIIASCGSLCFVGLIVALVLLSKR